MARTWFARRSGSSFLGPKFWFLVQKSDFCHMTPILVNNPLALTMTINFPPWERFFNFLFRSYSCFRKKIMLTAQKIFQFASNSPSAGLRASCAGWIMFFTSSAKSLTVFMERFPTAILILHSWDIAWADSRTS